jgi:chromosome segregation ATPase
MSGSMRLFLFFLCGSFLLGGCVAANRQTAGLDELLEPTVVFRASDSGYILSCLQELGSLHSKEFNAYFSATEARLENGDDEDQLRFICLSLSTKANYKQFKQGEGLLEQYIKEHPDSQKEMAGLRALVDRLDQAKVTRWSSRKKMLDEKEELEAEVAALQARIETLQGEHEQDTVRIKELRNQIEQLKNIENIIKNREHGS